MTDGELDELRSHRLLAILRAAHPGRLGDVLTLLRDGGVRWAEISLTTPSALDAVREFLPHRGALRLGIGSVTTEAQVAAAADAGAAFVVTPVMSAPALHEAAKLDLPAIVGGFTPTELWRAQREGAAAVKLFPAAVGGPGYLRAVKEPLPDLRVIPVGGVDARSAPRYLESGALAVGMGSPLIGDSLRVANADEALADRVREAVAAVHQAA